MADGGTQITRPRCLYADKHGQVAVRYVRLLTFGRFELALTWIARSPMNTP